VTSGRVPPGARQELAVGVAADLPGRVAVRPRADQATEDGNPPRHAERQPLAGHPRDQLAGDLGGDDPVQVRVVGRRRGQCHRRRRELLLLDQLVDVVLAEHAGEDGVAHARVVEVVAAQVRDPGDHPALDEGQPGDVGGDRERGGHEPADVGDEAPGAGKAHVVLDHLAHGEVDVAALFLQLRVGSLRGRWQGTDAVDRAVQRLPHERGREVR
jgi:hypothetical protein